MIKAIIDNNIWLYLLLTRDKTLLKILISIEERKLEVQFSEPLFRELEDKLKAVTTKEYLDIQITKSFIKATLPLFKFHKNVPHQNNTFTKEIVHYIDLFLYTESEFLVPYDYKVFRPADGYQRINVVEFENFVKNLSY